MVEDFWISFVVASLVVYRLSRMLALEEGPFDIFMETRAWAWKRFEGKAWIQAGIQCPLCISFWLAIPIAILVTLQLHYPFYAFFWLWLALSGAASFLYRLEN